MKIITFNNKMNELLIEMGDSSDSVYDSLEPFYTEIYYIMTSVCGFKEQVKRLNKVVDKMGDAPDCYFDDIEPYYKKLKNLLSKI